MKMTREITLAAVLFLSLAGTGSGLCATAQQVDQRLDFLFGSHEKFHNFFNDMQHAVGANDRAKLATMIAYPLNVSLQGKKFVIHNQSEFGKRYPAIFTPAFRKAITDQKYADLFARDTGVMVGANGELWFSEICKDATCKKSRVLIVGLNN